MKGHTDMMRSMAIGIAIGVMFIAAALIPLATTWSWASASGWFLASVGCLWTGYVQGRSAERFRVLRLFRMQQDVCRSTTANWVFNAVDSGKRELLPAGEWFAPDSGPQGYRTNAKEHVLAPGVYVTDVPPGTVRHRPILEEPGWSELFNFRKKGPPTGEPLRPSNLKRRKKGF